MGKRKYSKFFPALFQKTASASPGGTLPQVPDLLDLITDIKETTTTTPNISSSNTVDENHEEPKGIPMSKFNTKLQMWGKASTGDMMDIPAWMQKFATKGTRKHYN